MGKSIQKNDKDYSESAWKGITSVSSLLATSSLNIENKISFLLLHMSTTVELSLECRKP